MKRNLTQLKTCSSASELEHYHFRISSLGAWGGRKNLSSLQTIKVHVDSRGPLHVKKESSQSEDSSGGYGEGL